MKPLIYFSLLLFMSLTLSGCVKEDDEDVFIFAFIEDPTHRDIYILNNTNETIYYCYVFVHPYSRIKEYEPNLFNHFYSIEPHKRKKIDRYDTSNSNEVEIHVLTYAQKTLDEYGGIRAIKAYNVIERYYKIKCSELEEKYNTIIIYDDDDTSKW